MTRRPLKECGSPAAYRRHLRHGEEACAKCRRAQADDIAARRANPPVKPRELRPCGSQAAYERHMRLAKKLREAGDLDGARAAAPCFLCRVAHSHHVAKYAARKRAAA